MPTAKLFRNGRSQAVRLPKEFRFEGDEVSIHRECRTWPRGYWQSWGKASRDLQAPEPLPPGGGPIDLDDR